MILVNNVIPDKISNGVCNIICLQVHIHVLGGHHLHTFPLDTESMALIFGGQSGHGIWQPHHNII